MTGVRLHDGVRVLARGHSILIADEATATSLRLTVSTEARVADDVLLAHLLASGLGRAPRRERARVIAECGLDGTSLASTIHERGRCRRFTAPRPGPASAALAGAAAMTTTWALAALVAATLFAALFAGIGGTPATVVAAASAPLALVVVTTAHEVAHWVALRLLHTSTAGAMLIGWRSCMIVHAFVPGVRGRLIALAGPLTGLTLALAYLAIDAGGVIVSYVGTLLVLANGVGLLPWSADGRRLFARASRATTRASRATTRASGVDGPGLTQ